MTTAQLAIPEFFYAEDVDRLHTRIQDDFDTTNVVALKHRKKMEFPEAVALAVELVKGSWLAGGCFTSSFYKTPIRNFNIYFRSSTDLLKQVGRIQNAPEGSYLYGYETNQSVREFADGLSPYIEFTHETKPPIHLMRVRWFPDAKTVLDKLDFEHTRVAIDCELNITLGFNTLEDIKSKRIRIQQSIFETGTMLRYKRLRGEGWGWSTGRYDSYWRDDALRKATEYAVTAKKIATATSTADPTLDPYFGAFHV